jgi:hypothetical protein
MKEASKRKSGTTKTSTPKKPAEAAVIRLDDLAAPPGVRGGKKTFFGSK